MVYYTHHLSVNDTKNLRCAGNTMSVWSKCPNTIFGVPSTPIFFYSVEIRQNCAHNALMFLAGKADLKLESNGFGTLDTL